jgi:hypothetical protein
VEIGNSSFPNFHYYCKIKLMRCKTTDNAVVTCARCVSIFEICPHAVAIGFGIRYIIKGPTVIGICCCGDPALVGKAK